MGNGAALGVSTRARPRLYLRTGFNRCLEFVHFSRRGGGVENAIGRIQTEVGDQLGVFRQFFAQ